MKPTLRSQTLGDQARLYEGACEVALKRGTPVDWLFMESQEKWVLCLVGFLRFLCGNLTEGGCTPGRHRV